MLYLIYREYSEISGKSSLLRALYKYSLNNGFRALCHIRRISETKNKILKDFFIGRLERRYGIKMGTDAVIGKRFIIHHPTGIVIGNNVVIGDDCEIFHQVTLGQKNNQYPVLGNNVTLYPGCKIIGGIHIGDNAVIAPNTVVIKDVPQNAVVSGVPAKIISQKEY